MKNTRAGGWVLVVGAAATALLGGCDLIAGIGEFCEKGVDPGCGAGGSSGAGGTTTSPTGGGGTGGALGCSPAGTKQECYSGPAGTIDVGACVGGEQTCQEDGTWGPCDDEIVPGVETCASDQDEDCDKRECALWDHIFGDDDQQIPLDIAVDSQGNVVLLGNFKGTINLGGADLHSAGGTDLFLAKFNASGQHLWSKGCGDAKEQFLASLALDSAGNIIVAGTFEGTLDFGGASVTGVSGGTDAFLVKLTPGGAPAWAKSYGDPSNQGVYDVTVDSSDDILMIGEFAGSLSLKDTINAVGGTDVWVARIDGFGGTPLGQIQIDDKSGQSLTLNITSGQSGTWAMSGQHGNGAVVGGATLSGSGSFVAKYGANDTPIWSVHSPLLTPSGVLLDSAGDVIFAADFFNSVDVGGTVLTSKGVADIALVKLASADGTGKWAKSFGGEGNEQAARIARDADDNLFFALSGGSPSIGFGGEQILGKGLEDLFVVALNSDGSHRWSRGFGDATSQGAPRLGSDVAGKPLIVAVQTSGTINFGGMDLSSNGNDIAIAKLAP